MRKYVLFAVIFLLLVPVISHSEESNSLILLNAKNQQETEEAIKIIESVGGQVRHVFIPDVLIGFLPEDVDTILIHRAFVAEIRHGEAETKDYSIVTEANTKVIKAWNRLLINEKATEVKPEVSSEASKDLFDCDVPLGDQHLYCCQSYCVLDIDRWEFQTSSYMIGRVAVGIILMESNGSAENWTTEQEEKTISEIVQGLDALSSLANGEDVNLCWFYDIHCKVPTTFEPIQEERVPSCSWLPYPHCKFLWIIEALNHLGFESYGYSGMYDYVNHIRTQYQTDWSYMVFVVMDENDPDHKFSNNLSAAASLGGPCVVMTYYNWDYGPDGMSSVIAHETCHIFGANDEYSGACNSDNCTKKYGYLQVENGNCEACNPHPAACLMRHSPTHYMCDYTKGQIGWRDSDGDGPADPIDPNSGLHAQIGPVYPGDMVRIFTVAGDFVKLIPITPDNCAKFPLWSGYMTFWNGTNAWGSIVPLDIYLGAVNDGKPFKIGPTQGDPNLPPLFSEFGYENDTLTWKLSQTYAWVRCKIYNESQHLALYPVKDKLYLATDHPYEYQTDVSALQGGANYTSKFFGWRPDGGRSQIYEYSFYIPECYFTDPINFATGPASVSVFCADLDGDSDLDLAVANDIWNGKVSVLKNNGDGTFQTAVNYAAGDIPSSVFCADLDGDLDLDLTVANQGYDSVSILKNNGDGTFQTEVNYQVGWWASMSVFCADLDGDSDLDLAVANIGTNSVSILKNNGNGIFQTKVDYSVGDNPISVFCADLDRDGDIDLAVANSGIWPNNLGSVSILKNNGDGTFQPKVDYGAGNSPHSVFCTDLDGDLDLDLAVANLYSVNVSILKNNGDGTFQAKVDYSAGEDPRSVFCADIDGDSDLDLAVANADNNNVSILKNNGNGTFQAKVDYSVGSFPWSVFSADLDGDLDWDLSVANRGSDNVSILKNLTNIPANQPPWPFGLLAPEDGDSIPPVELVDWATPYDPNFGDQIKYDLYMSMSLGFPPDSTFIHSNLATSRYNNTLFTDTSDVVTYYWKVKARDNWGAERWSTQTWSFNVFYLCGDCNGEGQISVSDVVYLVDYLFKGGSKPVSIKAADSNGDGKVSVSDVVYLINYLFKGGSPPVC